jgi:RNA polymerase sigma-70 factor (ECF subfamily)
MRAADGAEPSRGLDASDDEVLMARFAAGDARAFGVLYDRYESSLYGFCLRLLGERDLADDAFQDTFFTLIDQRFAYRDQGRLRSWLFTIARNVCLDRLRMADRRDRLRPFAWAVPSALVRSPARAIEERDELTRLLALLPADQREILLLHRHAGFSYAEIAEMKATTEAAVKQKAYRAAVALREAARES